MRQKVADIICMFPACPWAHRTLIYRALKGLEDHITVSVVSPYMRSEGWTFDQDFPGVVADPLHGATRMHQVYTAADSAYTGRVTVPVLWDKKLNTIVSNESAEIIRMFDTEFNAITGGEFPVLAPSALMPQIDAVNERVYHEVNNGVYKAGFATSQDVYEQEVTKLFKALDWLEGVLADSAIWLVIKSLRQTGACSRPWCVLTPSMSGILSAI